MCERIGAEVFAVEHWEEESSQKDLWKFTSVCDAVSWVSR